MRVYIEANAAAEFEWSNKKHKVDYDKPAIFKVNSKVVAFNLIMALNNQCGDVKVCQTFETKYDVVLLIDNNHYYD